MRLFKNSIQSRRRARLAACLIATAVIGMATGCGSSRSDGSSTAWPASAVCAGSTLEEAHATLLRPESVLAVAEVFRKGPADAGAMEHAPKLSGVRILYRPARGLSSEWLQMLAICDRVAMRAPGRNDCPFEVPRTSAEVRSTGEAFAVELISDDVATAEELVRRAYRLRR